MKLRSGWKRRFGRGVLLFGVAPYLFLVGLFGTMQRLLIYIPSKEESISPEAARLLPGRVRAIELETDDDLTLNGWHFLAEGRTVGGTEPLAAPDPSPSPTERGQGEGGGTEREVVAEGRGLVLYFPGNAGDRRNRNLDCKDLADLGLDVFLFDYRGYGDNPGSPSEERLAADARSVWQYATETRDVAPERIILYGESLGGAVATRLASELCEAGTPPAALVLSATFPSLTDVGAYHYPWLPVRLVLLDRYPSTTRIASVTCPVLQVHGTADTIVPLDLARKLLAATPDRSAGGIAKRFVEVPDVGHNDIGVSNFRDVIEELLAQLTNGNTELDPDH